MSRLSAVLIVFALALVALGVYDVTRGTPTSEAPTADAPAAPRPATAAAGVDLSAVQASIGTVVTSGGATLYRFDKDTPKPPASSCNGQCAATWPPLLAAGGTPTVTGVDPALVGTVRRVDGAEQVTLNGWPLYRYAADGPGTTKGEGVAGTWHAVSPSGKPAVAATPGAGSGSAKAPAPAPAPAPEEPEEPEEPEQPEPGGSGY